MPRRLGRDLGRLGVARVVLPQPGVGRQFLLKLRLHGDWHPRLIHRDRRGTRRIDADADHLVRAEPRVLLGGTYGPFDGDVKPFDIVSRVLTSQVGVLGVQQDARLAAGIVVDVTFPPRPRPPHRQPTPARCSSRNPPRWKTAVPQSWPCTVPFSLGIAKITFLPPRTKQATR